MNQEYRIGDKVRYLDTDDLEDIGVIKDIAPADNPSDVLYLVEFPDESTDLYANEFTKVDE